MTWSFKTLGMKHSCLFCCHLLVSLMFEVVFWFLIYPESSTEVIVCSCFHGPLVFLPLILPTRAPLDEMLALCYVFFLQVLYLASQSNHGQAVQHKSTFMPQKTYPVLTFPTLASLYIFLVFESPKKV